MSFILDAVEDVVTAPVDLVSDVVSGENVGESVSKAADKLNPIKGIEEIIKSIERLVDFVMKPINWTIEFFSVTLPHWIDVIVEDIKLAIPAVVLAGGGFFLGQLSGGIAAGIAIGASGGFLGVTYGHDLYDDPTKFLYEIARLALPVGAVMVGSVLGELLNPRRELQYRVLGGVVSGLAWYYLQDKVFAAMLGKAEFDRIRNKQPPPPPQNKAEPPPPHVEEWKFRKPPPKEVLGCNKYDGDWWRANIGTAEGKRCREFQKQYEAQQRDERQAINEEKVKKGIPLPQHDQAKSKAEAARRLQLGLPMVGCNDVLADWTNPKCRYQPRFGETAAQTRERYKAQRLVDDPPHHNKAYVPEPPDPPKTWCKVRKVTWEPTGAPRSKQKQYVNWLSVRCDDNTVLNPVQNRQVHYVPPKITQGNKLPGEVAPDKHRMVYDCLRKSRGWYENPDNAAQRQGCIDAMGPERWEGKQLNWRS